MSPIKLRLLKEARQIAWPFAIITAAAVLTASHQLWSLPAWMPRGALRALAALGLLGIPVLATLVLGYEFQYRTIAGLLAAPIDRRRVWLEKFIVTLAAVSVPSAIFMLTPLPPRLEANFQYAVMAWVFVCCAGAMYWTLVARSTIGGMAVNNVANSLLYLAVSLFLGMRLDHPVPMDGATRSVAVILVVAYGGAMIFAGRRKLLQFQVTDGFIGEDAITVIASRVVPAKIGDLFRSRAKGWVLNLVRRELRLLAPVWLLTVVYAITWIVLLQSGMLNSAVDAKKGTPGLAAMAVIITAMIAPMIAILAGALSIGEDKNYGTHQMHMTMPVSSGAQWTVKFLVAISTGVFCAAVVPLALLLTAGMASGNAHLYVSPTHVWLWPLYATLLTTLSFWLSCVLKGTVRTAMAVLPMLFAIGMFIDFGGWSAKVLTGPAGGWMEVLLFWLDPIRVSNILQTNQRIPELMYLTAAVVAFGFIVLHSYRMFRQQEEPGFKHLLRSFLPIPIAVFLCSFVVSHAMEVLHRGDQQAMTMFRETHEAIEHTQPRQGTEVAKSLPSVTSLELAQATTLSPSTRRLLGSAVIHVVPQGNGKVFPPGQLVTSDRPPSGYRAIFKLENGNHCIMLYQPGVGGHGFLSGSCQ